MIIYIIVVFGIVVITSALLMFILSKFEILNYRIVLAIALSSVLASLLFPGIFHLLAVSRGGSADITELSFVLITTLVLYIMLTFILSIVISVVIPGNAFVSIADGIKNGKMAKTQQKASLKTDTINNVETAVGENYLEQIYTNLVVDKSNESTNIEDITGKAENNLEISVDSEEIIDKMGLETFEHDNFLSDGNNDVLDTNIVTDETFNETLEDVQQKTAESLSINDCVDEAFRLKEQGDFEGAILYYMYALDRKPDKDLIFWIVLDICVLYKTLEQIELARDILTSYVDKYSDLMVTSIKEEIIENLLFI